MTNFPISALPPGTECWIELEAVVPPPAQQAAPDTFYGRGVGEGGNYPVIDVSKIPPGYAMYDVVNNKLSVWDGTQWNEHTIRPGDEFVDLTTGTVYALAPRDTP
jgi:hypothetical protein